jgi:ATP-dependent exoDNAse (exonuclease V) beta subunit
MPAPPIDDAQARERIRHDLDTNLIIEAAAGTGKTSQLVQRIVAVLASGLATVGEIVAVTFTEKAAGELKLRLRTELDRARQRITGEPVTPASTSRTARLEDALAHLEEARISTLHAFCADLLRERPVEARIDPRFEVLIESEAQELFGRVFDDWVAAALEQPGEGVRRALRRESRFDEESSPSDRLKHAAWTLAEWRDFRAPWRRDGFDRAAAIDALVQQLHDHAALTGRASSRQDNLYSDTAPVRYESRRIQQVETSRTRDYDWLESVFVGLAGDRRVKNPRKGGWNPMYAEGIARSAMQEAHARFVQALDAFARAADADLAALLHQELVDLIDRYDAAKRRLGRVDFLDLLLRARDMLLEHRDVRAAYQRQLKRLFVDEFQDTDPLQVEILFLLASDDADVSVWREVQPRPGSLFVVGDPKQSIYRFRRADLGIYDEVTRMLTSRGAACLQLTRSFRATPALQRAVNAAFAPVITHDPHSQQAAYVPLQSWRSERTDQPPIVALPVPHPYGYRNIAGRSIEESLPNAVGAFVHWLLRDSGWTVTDRTRPDTPRPVTEKDVCILFRRFDKFRTDVTRPYLSALEARGIPHLLVGGRSFHEREEVDTLRTALTAIEWPDDELSVYATLHGSLFAITDEPLFHFRSRFGRLHPFRIPDAAALEAADGPDPRPVVEALLLLQQLHRRRNYVPVLETVWRLLDATRAYAGFVLRPSGEQALANVLQVAELGRRYDSAGALSFRGFVEQLQREADASATAEAPILEEGSEGVRVMTVHKAKGLEFPVVILADITANLSHAQASRFIDPERNLAALRLAGWSPADLLDRKDDERVRDRAEGHRVAYVAATRARDLLIVPAVGDGPYGSDDKWVGVLNDVIYPPVLRRRTPGALAGGPSFGPDTVLGRPDGDPAGPDTVAPGLFQFDAGYSVAWWDPGALTLDCDTRAGIRHDALLDKRVEASIVAVDRARYEEWRGSRQRALDLASQPSVIVQTVTERARAPELPLVDEHIDVTVVDVRRAARVAGRAAPRPSGKRFGTLLHAVLAHTPLDADTDATRRVAELQARVLGADDAEVTAAVDAVQSLFAHDVLQRVRAAGNRVSREVPIGYMENGVLIEGTADLVVLDDDRAVVMDFKTDAELDAGLEWHRRQMRLYARGLMAITGRPAEAIIVRI